MPKDSENYQGVTLKGMRNEVILKVKEPMIK
jgi:hypothetical protein